jgi:hypothetical protein
MGGTAAAAFDAVIFKEGTRGYADEADAER